MRRMVDDPAYVRFRDICLALPETKVTMTWGSPHLRVGDKIFTGWSLDDDKRSWSFNVKVDKDKQAALIASDPRFTTAPYVGKHGWVSVQITKRKENWGEIAALVEESYRNIASKKQIAKLDGAPTKKPTKKPTKTKKPR
jgi:predicted DNA-binding protein (MmcQ/YjbR family)